MAILTMAILTGGQPHRAAEQVPSEQRADLRVQDHLLLLRRRRRREHRSRRVPLRDALHRRGDERGK